MNKHDKNTSPDMKSSGRKSRLQEAAMKKFSDTFKRLFDKWKTGGKGRSQKAFGDILYYDILKRTDIENTQPAVSRWYRGVGSLPTDEELDSICQILNVDKEIFEPQGFMDGFQYSADTQDKILEAYNIKPGSERIGFDLFPFLSFLKSMLGYDYDFPLYTPLEFNPNGFDVNDKKDEYASLVKTADNNYRYKRAPYSFLPNAAKSNNFQFLQVEKDGHYKNLSEPDLQYLRVLKELVCDFIRRDFQLHNYTLKSTIPSNVNSLMSSFKYSEDDEDSDNENSILLPYESYKKIQDIVVKREDCSGSPGKEDAFTYDVTGDYKKQKEDYMNRYYKLHSSSDTNDISKADKVVNDNKKSVRTANKRKEDNNGDD